MSSPILTTDSNGPFVNDRWVNSFANGSSTALVPGNVVKIVSSQSVGLVAVSSDTILGVVWNTTPPGGIVGVICRGEVASTSDNAVSAGDLLIAGANGAFHSIGQAAVGVAVGSALPFVRGQALESQSTAGTVFKSFLY